MDVIQIIVLALLQGITEFLPISSSAHLILVPMITQWSDQSLSFDIAVHVGTLSAVVFYFRYELVKMTKEWFQSVFAANQTEYSRLAWAVIVGTIPLGICGITFKSLIETQLRSPIVIAVATIIFGLLLWYAASLKNRNRTETALSWKDIAIIGVAQALALIPGTSRSGITITAGLLCGLNAQASARFSFLLSIPAITAAGLLMVFDVVQAQQAIEWKSLLLGAFVSALSAWFCIHFFLKLLERIGMTPFVIYRLILGVVLLWVFWV